jgi:glycosyltransferase involved in cell wall biosynthesis
LQKIIISIIIPSFNVENTIFMVIENISKIMNESKIIYEILAINDGSDDRTLEVLHDSKKLNSKLKIISYNKNKGKGYAIKQGVLKSNGDIVLFIDGDLDITLQSILDFIKELDDYDLVIGSKLHLKSEIESTFSRQCLSRIFNFVVRVFTGLKIKDTQVGLKAGDGTILRKIFQLMTINGFAFDVEMLTISSIMNLKIKEMPVKIKLNKKFRFYHSMKMFQEVVKISWKSKVLHSYQKINMTVNLEGKK